MAYGPPPPIVFPRFPSSPEDFYRNSKLRDYMFSSPESTESTETMNETTSKCPVCEMRRARALRHAVAESAESYGKISKDIFLKLIEKEETARESLAQENETMRQYPERLHMEDGVLKVGFRAKCFVCDLEVKHNEEVTFADIEKENYE